jgi:2'-5' RNA ligase
VRDPSTLAGNERARLFCGLRLPDNVLDALSAWQDEHVRKGRPVTRENLHVTLAFLGHRPVEELSGIADATREAAAAAGTVRLEPARYRETRSVGMLVLSDEERAAAAVAEDLHERLEALGVYKREQRPWLPHLTVVRFRERPRLRPPVPALGPFTPSDASVFISRLHPTGARYEVVESFALGG